MTMSTTKVFRHMPTTKYHYYYYMYIKYYCYNACMRNNKRLILYEDNPTSIVTKV